MKLTLPAQVYGKQKGIEKAPYETLSTAPELEALAAEIQRTLSFQWLGDGSSDRLPEVWYLYLLPSSPNQALLCRFEDVGADPRPHTLRRTVGLCTREHATLLAAIRNGKARDINTALHTHGQWMLEYEDCSGKEFSEWKSGFLQEGATGSYELRVQGEKVSKGTPAYPVPRESHPSSSPEEHSGRTMTTQAAPTRRTWKIHALWGLLCLTLLLSVMWQWCRCEKAQRKLEAMSAELQEVQNTRMRWDTCQSQLEGQQKRLESMQQGMKEFLKQMKIIHRQNEELRQLIRQLQAES